MRSVLRLPIYTTAAACAALVLAGCGGGGGGGGSTSLTRSLTGRVFSAADGSAVNGATVTVGTRNATTDGSGIFRVEGLSEGTTTGTVQVTRTGFVDGSATFTLSGSALQVPSIGLTPAGTPVAVNPAVGGVVQQSVPAAPGLPQFVLNIPAGALPGSSTVQVAVSPVVNQPSNALVGAASVRSQAVGDASVRGPEVFAGLSPSGLVLTGPVEITIPLPFAVPAGQQVPIIQLKNGTWREVGMAVVDGSGASATGAISEFVPTGAMAWHDLQFTRANRPGAQLAETALASINNNILNLGDRHYVVTRTIEAGRTADITARFDSAFEAPQLPTSPVDEETLVLGTLGFRNVMLETFFSGPWNMAGGPVTCNVRERSVIVRRFLAGQNQGNAGSFVSVYGVPNWTTPFQHNQGGVQ